MEHPGYHKKMQIVFIEGYFPPRPQQSAWREFQGLSATYDKLEDTQEANHCQGAVETLGA